MERAARHAKRQACRGTPRGAPPHFTHTIIFTRLRGWCITHVGISMHQLIDTLHPIGEGGGGARVHVVQRARLDNVVPGTLPWYLYGPYQNGFGRPPTRCRCAAHCACFRPSSWSPDAVASVAYFLSCRRASWSVCDDGNVRLAWGFRLVWVCSLSSPPSASLLCQPCQRYVFPPFACRFLLDWTEYAS